MLAALKIKDSPKAMHALLSAPHYLSGLSASEQETLRKQWASGTAAGKEQQDIESALAVCGDAVDIATRMVMQRAQIRADGSDAIS